MKGIPELSVLSFQLSQESKALPKQKLEVRGTGKTVRGYPWEGPGAGETQDGSRDWIRETFSRLAEVCDLAMLFFYWEREGDRQHLLETCPWISALPWPFLACSVLLLPDSLEDLDWELYSSFS